MDEVEELRRTLPHPMLVLDPVRAGGVEELLPDRDDRVERVEGGLEDHRAFGPAVLAEVVVVELADVRRHAVLRVEDLARRDPRTARRQSDQADREGRLARAALADDRESLALLELEGDVAHRVDGAPARQVVDGKTAHREDRHGSGASEARVENVLEGAGERDERQLDE